MAPKKTKVLGTAATGADVINAYNKARATLVDIFKPLSLNKQTDGELKLYRENALRLKQKIEFTATFDGQTLQVVVVIPTLKDDVIDTIDVKAIGDDKRVFEVMKKLAALGLASAPKDPDEATQKQKTISDLESVIKSANLVKASYTKYTYASDEPAIYGALEKWAGQHSQGQYLQFLDDITSKVSPQKIFDTYIKKGAAKPVNLTPGVAAAVEKDLKANKPPNFSAAQKEILNVVNTKIVPAFKKEMLAGLDQGIVKNSKDLAKLKQELKTVGAK